MEVIALFVVWKRRKGQPVELRGMTSGGMLQALLVSKALAKNLKIPESWVEMRVYREARA